MYQRRAIFLLTKETMIYFNHIYKKKKRVYGDNKIHSWKIQLMLRTNYKFKYGPINHLTLNLTVVYCVYIFPVSFFSFADLTDFNVLLCLKHWRQFRNLIKKKITIFINKYNISFPLKILLLCILRCISLWYAKKMMKVSSIVNNSKSHNFKN